MPDRAFLPELIIPRLSLVRGIFYRPQSSGIRVYLTKQIKSNTPCPKIG